MNTHQPLRLFAKYLIPSSESNIYDASFPSIRKSSSLLITRASKDDLESNIPSGLLSADSLRLLAIVARCHPPVQDAADPELMGKYNVVHSSQY